MSTRTSDALAVGAQTVEHARLARKRRAVEQRLVAASCWHDVTVAEEGAAHAHRQVAHLLDVQVAGYDGHAVVCALSRAAHWYNFACSKSQ